MVRPVEVIRRDMDGLKRATTSLAEEFNHLYGTYLASLGTTLQRQLIMAAYHLCTQVYPDSFLALSVSQREALQRQIRQLGAKGKDWLGDLLDPKTDLDRLEPSEPEPQGAAIEPPELEAEDSESFPEVFQEAREAGARSEPQESSTDRPSESPMGQEEEALLAIPSLLKQMVMAALAEERLDDLGDRLFSGDDLTPLRLAKHHIYLEQQIRDLLQRISRQANQRLHSAKILPNLPDAVLNAASDAEIGPGRGRSVPNVLNVMVAIAPDLSRSSKHPLDSSLMEESSAGDREEDEDEDEEDQEDEEGSESTMTHLAAINLRLSDLEFNNVESSLGRSKLRTALGTLRKLGKQYQKLQRELAISSAEQAWRAIWYEEPPS
ncbi:MAG: hypothetical protein VKO01_02460 [Cyanobacteriota bacterium]|nr:hypothetical protein [Cyanobacteriota bacterium]